MVLRHAIYAAGAAIDVSQPLMDFGLLSFVKTCRIYWKKQIAEGSSGHPSPRAIKAGIRMHEDPTGKRYSPFRPG